MNSNEFIESIIKERGQWCDNMGYVERHHIIPRSLGGDNIKDNIVFLTPEEHYKVHEMLYTEHPDVRSIEKAWVIISRRVRDGKTITWTCEEYSEFRRTHAKKQSRRQSGEGNVYYGKKHSVEVRAKMSKSGRGRKLSKDTRDRIRVSKIGEKNGFYGKKHSEISRAKMSESSKRNWTEKHDALSLHMKNLNLKWWNNGSTEIKSRECPAGYTRGRIKKDVLWYTNGEQEVKSEDCPNGWYRGRSIRSRQKMSVNKKTALEAHV